MDRTKTKGAAYGPLARNARGMRPRARRRARAGIAAPQKAQERFCEERMGRRVPARTFALGGSWRGSGYQLNR